MEDAQYKDNGHFVSPPSMRYSIICVCKMECILSLSPDVSGSPRREQKIASPHEKGLAVYKKHTSKKQPGKMPRVQVTDTLYRRLPGGKIHNIIVDKTVQVLHKNP